MEILRWYYHGEGFLIVEVIQNIKGREHRAKRKPNDEIKKQLPNDLSKNEIILEKKSEKHLFNNIGDDNIHRKKTYSTLRTFGESVSGFRK